MRIYKYPVVGEEQKYCIGNYNHGDKVTNVKFALTNSDENGILFRFLGFKFKKIIFIFY